MNHNKFVWITMVLWAYQVTFPGIFLWIRTQILLLQCKIKIQHKKCIINWTTTFCYVITFMNSLLKFNFEGILLALLKIFHKIMHVSSICLKSLSIFSNCACRCHFQKMLFVVTQSCKHWLWICVIVFMQTKHIP